MNDNNYFHSNEFFMALEKTPGMKPCMAIAITQDQQVVGHMLAVIVTRRWFLPPISLRYGMCMERDAMRPMQTPPGSSVFC